MINKIKKVGLITALLMMSCIMANADSGWGIFAAGWAPEDGAASYGPGAEFQFELSPGLVLSLRGTYFNNVSDQDDVDLEVIPFEAGLDFALHPADMINLYFGAGAGYYMLDGSYSAPRRVVADFDPEDTVGYYANASIEFLFSENVRNLNATHASFFVEALYRGVEIDKASVNNKTYAIETLTLSGFGVNAGLMLRW